jgi:hypothetical protein
VAEASGRQNFFLTFDPDTNLVEKKWV